MSFLGNDPFSQMPLQDFLIKKLLLSHNPDGRRLDSELLLLAVENVIFYATKTSQVPLLVPPLAFYIIIVLVNIFRLTKA